MRNCLASANKDLTLRRQKVETINKSSSPVYAWEWVDAFPLLRRNLSPFLASTVVGHFAYTSYTAMVTDQAELFRSYFECIRHA